MPLCPPQAVYPGVYCRVWSPGFQHTRNSGSLGSDVGYQPDSHNDAVSEGFRAQTRSWKKCCTEVWFLFNIVFWQWAVEVYSLLKESNVRQQRRYSKMSDFSSVFSQKSPFAQAFYGFKPSVFAKYFQSSFDTRATDPNRIYAKPGCLCSLHCVWQTE